MRQLGKRPCKQRFIVSSSSFPKASMLKLMNSTVQDVTTRHRPVAQVDHDGAADEGGGGEGQGLKDSPHHQRPLRGRRLHAQVSTIFRVCTL